MTHLFQNEDLSRGLRALSDLDLLLRHFGATTAYWDRLVERARELELTRPLYYGLRQAQRILGTPVPAATLQAAQPFRFEASWIDSGLVRFAHRILRRAAR